MEVLKALTHEVKKAEEKIKEEYKSSPEAQLLSTVPGVGLILSLTILSEIGEISRFKRARQLSSYCGLCPSTAQSGNTLRHGRITRQGSKWLRWAFVEAAIQASGKPGPLRDFYLKLKKRKGGKIARVAVARKISIYVFHMLKEKKTFAEVISLNRALQGELEADTGCNPLI